MHHMDDPKCIVQTTCNIGMLPENRNKMEKYRDKTIDETLDLPDFLSIPSKDIQEPLANKNHHQKHNQGDRPYKHISHHGLVSLLLFKPTAWFNAPKPKHNFCG